MLQNKYDKIMLIICEVWRKKFEAVSIFGRIESTKELKEEDLKSIEEELKLQKETLLKENENYNEELKKLREEYKRIEQEENDYWDSIANFERIVVEAERDSSKINKILENVEAEKERLKNFNNLGELFKISVDGDIGIINGFLFGCLEKKEVNCK